MIHVVAGALFDAQGRVLIAQRPAGKHMAGGWEFPGGKREPGEEPRDTLVRELHEELGIEVHEAAPLIHGQAVRDMHAIYPDAKLIYIVRDGRDVLISERFRNLVEESKFLKAEDKQVIEELRKDQTQFANGTRSIFTESVIRRVVSGWVKNLQETEDEGRRLFGEHYCSLRYEDLLAHPFDEMQRLWNFLGVQADPSLEKTGRRRRAPCSRRPP